MSLILEALKKLERDKQVDGRGGFLVMAARPWPGRDGRRLFIASVALAGLGLGTLALAGAWWWRHAQRTAVVPSGTATVAATASSTARPGAPAIRREVAELPAPVRVDEDQRPVHPPAPAHAIATRPPAEATTAPATTTASPEIRLAAISVRDGRPVAILNDRLVYEGDSFDGVKVVRIGENEVEVEVGGHRRVVRF